MSKRVILSFISILLLGSLLVACGGSDNATGGAGDAKRGQALYEQTILGPNAAPGCVACHSREAGKTLVGPSHAGIATIAESAVSGMTAEDFLKESITNPNAHVTEGFVPGVMYQNYGKDLSEQEINDIVAYLLSLK
jgi:cytochrome c553